MSVRVLSMVWDGYPGGGTELLALLALADWSDDAGKCYPSISAIARKTRLSRSQAQRIVHQLIDDGFLVVTANALGGAPTQTRHYRIALDRLTGRADATRTSSTHATGSAHAQEGSHPCGERGSTHATQTVSEPSVHVNPVVSVEPTRRKQAKSSTPEDPKGFSECWAAYPKRSGGNSRAEALKAYRARLKAGAEPDALLTGVKRYAAFIAAKGKTGTEFVKQAKVFFGPGEHWMETWALPTEGAGTAGSSDIFKGAL